MSFKNYLISEVSLGAEDAMKTLVDLKQIIKNLDEKRDGIMELSDSKKKSLANHAYAISKILMKVG